MPEVSGVHPCPICEKDVDLSDKKAAYVHMISDEVHKAHLRKTHTEQFLNQACNSGILRRIKLR